MRLIRTTHRGGTAVFDPTYLVRLLPNGANLYTGIQQHYRAIRCGADSRIIEKRLNKGNYVFCKHAYGKVAKRAELPKAALCR